jgi:hypothetical protein
VEEHDRRSCHRRPLTWRLSRVIPSPQHDSVPSQRSSADLARKQSGFDQLAGEHVPRRRACQLPRLGR